MTIANWTPPSTKIPSPTHKGETDTTTIYQAVGEALSAWEHFESGLTRLFQLFCETPSFAACRAYGTVDSSFGRAQMLRAAAKAFFAHREPFDDHHYSVTKALLTAYEKSQQFRNNLAHGIAVGFFISSGHSGYFLCPPSYATKKVEKIDPKEVYLLGAAYWYKAEDIRAYTERFRALLAETMNLIQSVNGKYAVLKDWQFHP